MDIHTKVEVEVLSGLISTITKDVKMLIRLPRPLARQLG